MMNRKDFEQPSLKYRSVPFWSWNDQLEDEQLREQIKAFRGGGQGGFFMHARTGLKTPYLSEEWFEHVKTCVAEAEHLGLYAWLYDEDNWPSGFAGGLVANQNERYRARALVCLVSGTASSVEEALLQVTGVFEGNQLKDLRPWQAGEPLEKGQKLIQCYPWVAPLGRAFLKGSSYIDTLNPEAVQAFLHSTHERYKTQVGEAFGKTILGIFTDEPSLGFGRAIPKELRSQALPWTDDLPKLFQEQHGYDVVAHLASLFFDTEDAPAVRHDFWSTVTKQFRGAWSQQLYDWCDANTLKLVGHHNGEDSLLEQMRWTGGVMPHYRYYHFPGIDKLGRSTGEVSGGDIDGGIVGLKQLDSVACQTGKERTLCEAFGCTGQDFALEGRWWQTNWLAVLGINFFNPHLAPYSLRGGRKRDYPPTLSPHQPWWFQQQPYEDAVARLSYALSQGKRCVDVLVIHPMTSAWVTYTPGSVSTVKELDRMLLRLANSLLAMHVDYHFADETLLAELGGVGDKVLNVGEQNYKVVIIPEVPTLEHSTVNLLNQFARSGGTILCLGKAPVLINGRKATEPILPSQTLYLNNEVSDEAMAHLPNDPARVNPEDDMPLPLPTLPHLQKILEQVCPPRIIINGEGADRVWYQVRTLEDERELLFIANIHEENTVDISLTWQGTGKLERWNVVSGEITSQPSEQTHSDTQVTIELPRMGNILLMRDSKSQEIITPSVPKRSTLLTLKNEWTLERQGSNVLVLDCCAYKLGSTSWQSSEYVLHVMEKITEEGHGAPFAVRFKFEVDVMPASCDLIIEAAPTLQLELNSKPLPAPDGFWLDPTFQRYKIVNLLQKGTNRLELCGTYTDDTELEAVYLLGEFSVPATYTGEEVKSRGSTFKRWQVEPTLKAVTQQTYYCDDLVSQGLPHFVGEVLLSQTFNLSNLPENAQIYLELGALQAATAVVMVNGQHVGQLSWHPLQLNITQALKQGENTLSITLVTSLRNLFGPFHTERGDPTFVSPATFSEFATQDYWLVTLGLGKAVLKAVVNSEVSNSSFLSVKKGD